jgi:uncharacterized protein
MRCVDVNVLVYAHRRESPDHERYVAWLDDARRGPEPLGLPSVVGTGFVRVVTHRRIFRDPSPLDEALQFVRALRSGPSVLDLEAGPRHGELFERLCREADARGNLVPDAHLAAVAVEHGATLYSADRSFARFASLRWRHPLRMSER